MLASTTRARTPGALWPASISILGVCMGGLAALERQGVEKLRWKEVVV